jgi:REP element-mobilizing transposase RayT
MLKFPPVVLSAEQRAFVEESVSSVCKRGGWELHACAGRGDHVHVMLSAQADGEAVRRWLKAWLGQALSERWRLPQGATWWAEGGSVKSVWDPRYFDDVFRYVSGQKTIGR